MAAFEVTTEDPEKSDFELYEIVIDELERDRR
jgi:hypothetical protein